MPNFLDFLPGVGDVVNAGLDWLQWEGEKDFARENRRFQARREDTAVQRRVADLRAAGLNPMLGYGSSAGSNASAAQPSGFSPSQSVARGAEARLASAHAVASTRLLDSQARNLDAQTASHLASAGQAEAHTRVLEAEVPHIASKIRHLDTEADLAQAKKLLTELDTHKLRAILPYLIEYERGRAARKGFGGGTLEAINEIEREWFAWLESVARKIRSGISSAADLEFSGPRFSVPNRFGGGR